MKARPEFADLDVDQVLEQLAPFIELTQDEAISIADEWDEIQTPADMSAVQWAAKMARQRPLRNVPGPKFPLYVEFVSLAAYLQITRGTETIYLPVELLAKILLTTPAVISRMRKLAKRVGLLKEIAPYRIKQAATQFRFAVERFPELDHDKQ